MGSSDFVFRKYMQESAFRVSGVLQLAKTGLTVTKRFPLLRLFLSAVMMARRFYPPCDVNCINLHILTGRGMWHILDWNWPTSKQEKKFVSISSKNKLQNSESEDHRKSRQKFHFIGTLRPVTIFREEAIYQPKLVFVDPLSWSNWNLEMLVFVE